MSIVNGDFSHSGNQNLFQVPGWSDHGGGGTEPVANGFLTVDHFGDVARTHNRFYIPANAGYLQFDLRRTESSSNDQFEVQLGDQQPWDFSLDAVDSALVTQRLEIPQRFRNTVQTLTFRIVAEGWFNFVVDSAVRIDNVRMSQSVSVPTAEPADIQITSTRLTFNTHEVVTLSGRVVDTQGRAVSGRQVNLNDSLLGRLGTIGQTDANGAFTVTYSSDDTALPGTFTLTFLVGSVRETVTIQLVDRVDLPVDPPGPTRPSIDSLKLLPEVVQVNSAVVATVHASDPNGNLAIIEIYRDLNGNGEIDLSDQQLARVTPDGAGVGRAEFYAYFAGGSHNILARAIDADRQSSATRSVPLTVIDDRPTTPLIVRFSASPSDTMPGDELTLRWLARDNTRVDHVELFLYRGNGTSDAFRVDTSSLVTGGAADGRLSSTANNLANSGSFIWQVPSVLPGGNDYRIRLVAVDEDGQRSERFTPFFSVTPRDGRVVSLSSEPGSVIQGNNVRLIATIANPSGATAVQFIRDLNRDGRFSTGDSILDNLSIGGDGRAEITVSTAGLEPGVHNFLARVVLPGGRFGNTVLRKVTVTGVPNQPPQIGSLVISPSSVVRGENITITANGVFDDRGIDSVIFVGDSDGDGEPDGGDPVLGRTSVIVGGRATITVPSTRLDFGTQRIIALVRDTDGRSSPWSGGTVEILVPNVPAPFIGGLTASALFQPHPITLTLTADDVLNATEVRFHFDANHSGQLDAGDTLLRIDDAANGYFWRDSPQNAGLPIGANLFFAQPFNQFAQGGNVVSIVVTTHPTDTTKPTATIRNAADVLAEATSYEFVVEYRDNIAMNAADFDNLDARVISAEGTWSAAAQFVTVDEPNDGPVRFVTYRIAARDGRFVSAHNSRYDIQIRSQELRDTNGNFLDATVIGSFEVAIPFDDATPPTVLIDELSTDVSSPTPIRIDADAFAVLTEDPESGIEGGSHEFVLSRFDSGSWGDWQFASGGGSSLVVGAEADGLYRVSATVRNRAGLTGISPVAYFLLDRGAPLRPQNVGFRTDTGQFPDDGLTMQELPTFVWDAAMDPVSAVVGYWFAVDDATPASGGGFTTDAFTTVRIPADGEHTFYVQTLDAAGNLSIANATRLTLDTLSPSLTGVTPATGSTVGRGPTVIDLHFNEPMDQSSLIAGNVTLSGSGVGTAVVAGVDWIDEDSARLTLRGSWSTGEVVVSLNAERPLDIAGNGVVPIEAGRFTIEPAAASEIVVTTSTGTDIEAGNFSVDFGSVELGASPPQATFTIGNTGTGTLTITDLSLPPGFRIVEAATASLSPGQTDTFTIELSTDQVGPQTGQLRLATNDLDEAVFDFSVRGQVTSPGITALYDWAIPIGDTGSDLVYDVAVDAAGYVYATGRFQGTVDFDPSASQSLLTSNGGNDLFVAKYSPTRLLVWAKNVGGTSTDIGRGIAIDDGGNVLVTGEFRSTVDFDPGAGTASAMAANGYPDAFVLKLTGNGQFVWVKTIGANFIDVGYDIVTRNNEVFVVGEFTDTVDFNPGTGTFSMTSPRIAGDPTNGFLVKLDSSGNFVFANHAGGTSDDRFNGVTVASDGTVVVTGHFAATANFNPLGSAQNVSAVGNDALVVRYTSAGAFQWVRTFGGSSTDDGTGVGVDSQGNVYSTGYFYGTIDADPSAGVASLVSAGGFDGYLISLDSSGNYRWSRRFGGSNFDETRGLAMDGADNIYVTGPFQGTAEFNPGGSSQQRTSVGSDDVFALRVSSSNDFGWVRTVGGSSSDIGSGIAVAADGSVFVGATYQGTLDADPGSGIDTVPYRGNEDVLILRFEQPAPITNQSPTLVAIANQTVNEGSELRLTVSASDPDAGQSLTYSLDPGAPAGVSIVAGSGLLTWTPTERQGPETFTLTVRATDNGSLAFSDSRSFRVTVNELNAAPQLAVVTDRTATRGQRLVVQLVGSDSDLPANTLTYALVSGAPAGADCDPQTGVFDWTPDATSPGGVFDVMVSVTDNGLPALSASRTFHVTLDNAAPTLASMTNVAIAEDSAQQIILLSGITAGTGESQPLQVTVTSSNVSLIPQPIVEYSSPDETGRLLLRPTAGGSGFSDIAVTVRDAGFDGVLGNSDDSTIQRTFRLTVNAVNDLPLLDLIPDQVPLIEDSLGQTVEITGISAGTGESQALTVTAASSNTGLIPNPTVTYTSPNASGSLAYTPVVDHSGTATITVTVRDAGLDGVAGNSDDATFARNFVVTVNDAPPSVTLGVAPASLLEADSTSTVTATLSTASDLDVTVDLSFSGTATNVTDYTRSGTQIVITAGNTTGTVTLTAAQDAQDETNETIVVDITGVTNGTESGTQQVTATITDDDAPPSVTLDMSSGTLAEAGGTSTVTATLSAVSSFNVIVDLGVTGTATNVSDCTRSATQIVIAAGNTTGTITLTAVQDTLDEINETIIIDITSVTNGTESGTQQVTATITDDDSAVFSIGSFSATEGSGVVFTITLSNAVDVDTSVTFSTADGTATTGDNDYTAITSQLVLFTAGTTSRTATVNTTADSKVEANETFTASLGGLNAGGRSVTISPTNSSTTGTISNDDSAVFSIGSASATEGSGVVFTITLSNTVDVDTSLTFSTSNGTATTADGDYTAVSSQTVLFTAGTTSRTVTVNTTADSKVEANETFTASLGGLNAGGRSVTISGVNNAATGTITNNDSASFSIANASAIEGSGVTLTISLSAAVDVVTSMTVTTSDGTATIGNNDYTAVTSQTVTFAAGATSRTVTVNTTADNKVEANETFTASLGGLNDGGRSVTISDTNGSATGTISNNDSAVFSIVNASTTEGSDVMFTIVLSNAVDVDTSVTFSTANGTATTDDSDYTAVSSQVVSFTAGTTTQTVTVNTTDDNKVEGHETFTVGLDGLNAGGRSVTISATNGSATGTIANDDAETLTISSPTVTEGNSGTTSLTFTVTSPNAVQGGFTVGFSLADVTTNGSDHAALPNGTLAFAGTAGETQMITVTVNGDTAGEGTETLRATLGAVSPTAPVLAASIVSGAVGTGTITNDDLVDVIYTASGSAVLTVSVVSGRLQVKINNVPQTQFDSVDLALMQSITITGGAGADSINLTGLSSSTYSRLTRVSLNGGAGNDAIVGSNFDETISGGLGNDSLNGAGGTNTLSESGNVNFTLTNTSLVGVGTDTLANLQVANLTGGTSANTFTVSGWTRAGTLVGGGGTGDTIVASKNVNFALSNSVLQTTDGMNLSLSGFTKATLTGGAGNNTFTVGSWTGTGKLTGGTGTDTLSATRNASTTLTTTSLAATGFGTLTLSSLETAQLIGGDGNNLFTVTGWNGTGSVTGGGGTDTIVASRNANFTLSDTQLLASNGLTMTLAGLSIANLTGGTSANTFTVSGWTGSGKIDGSTSTTGTFDQIVAVRDTDMTLTNTSLAAAGFGTLTLAGIETANLSGGATANKLIAKLFTLGAVTLQGNGGDDALIGGSKNDSLLGGAGRDTIIGGAGNDTLRGGDDDDTLIGGLGADSVFGDSGADFGLGGRGSAARGGTGVKDTGDLLNASIETINEAFATVFAFEL